MMSSLDRSSSLSKSFCMIKTPDVQSEDDRGSGPALRAEVKKALLS